MTTYATSRGAALERAYRHWRERGALLELPSSKRITPPLTVAISRELGAGGGAIAQAVAKRTAWPLYDKELVDQIAEDTGVNSQLLRQLDETKPNWLAECLEGFSDQKKISGGGFAIRLRKILLALYCHGNCVILGRGAAQLLPPESTLRIRLAAPKKFRVQQLSKLAGSPEEAERMITQSDNDRASFVKSYFCKDATSIEGYDLILDTSRFSQQGCADIICSALEARRASGELEA